MAINKKLIHFKTREAFDSELEKGNILDTSIVFIKDTLDIWTHGSIYHCLDEGEFDERIKEYLEWKVLDPVIILNLYLNNNTEKVIINGIEYTENTKIIFREPTTINYKLIPKEGYFVYSAWVNGPNLSNYDEGSFELTDNYNHMQVSSDRALVHIQINEGIEKITFDDIDYYESIDVAVPPYRGYNWDYTLKETYGIVATSQAHPRISLSIGDYYLSPTAARIQININISEGIEKVIFNNTDYFESTTIYVPYIAYGNYSWNAIVSDGYGAIRNTSGSFNMYSWDYPTSYDISPIAGRVEVRLHFSEGIEKITFSGNDYYEDAQFYIPYGWWCSYSVIAKEGYLLTSNSSGSIEIGQYYPNGFDLFPVAEQPTYKVIVNEGVQKIVVNDEYEYYTESESIKVPVGSTINYKATAQEDYGFVPITWEIQKGQWNNSEETNAVDNQRFTCVSPGTNGMTTLRCTFTGISSITFTYRSDAESTYDYLIISKLDTDFSNITSWNASGTYSNSAVQDYTRGYQNSWRSYTYQIENPEEQHFVEFMFGKDSSQDTQPDNAQVYISNIIGGLEPLPEIQGNIVCNTLNEYVISPKAQLIE